MQILEILKYVKENTNSAFFYTPNIYEGGKSYLFKKPWKTLTAKTKEEVEQLLLEVDELSHDSNLIGFATIPYEIGCYFQPKEIKNSYLDKTELSFYFYEKKNVEIINSEELEYDNVEKYIKSNSGIKDIELDITEDEYVEKINKIKNYITKGDTYQINFTTKAKFKFDGELTSLFLNGIFNQSASYSVLINKQNEYILSFSPELFFSTDYRTITSKPMKGTLKRKGNPTTDQQLAASLLNDEKNLAENVMIVDLMRNDIGRISETDSVKVEKLFEAERYETLYQLTSTVTGQLREEKISEIIKNLFPSGSITGAPKIRSMQIIAELENSPRNLYTGSIGLISSESAVFNIPIRTITINKLTKESELGLGSGIVWDSEAKDEYKEVLLKGKFIGAPQKYFELLETMLFENGGVYLLNDHLKRLKISAEYFLFKYDETVIKDAISNNITDFEENKKYKIRLRLTKWGKLKIESDEIELSEKKIRIILSKTVRGKEDKFLYHKTTNRPWGKELIRAKQKGFDEILFINDNDELLEGAISNLIIEKNGKYYTPPIKLGILNGCYRQYLLDNMICEEKSLKFTDLKNADRIFLCNSVRKKMEVAEINDWNGDKIF